MTVEIKAPAFPESVADGTIATWHKKEGDSVTRDELVVDIETDKVVIEVVAPVTGVLSKISQKEDDVVKSGEVIGMITEGEVPRADSAENDKKQDTKAEDKSQVTKDTDSQEEPLLSPAVRKIIE